jgi:hypothetical protein
MSLQLSPEATSTAGVLLLSLLAVEWGGAFLIRVAQGDVEATDLQRRLYRAGHAHAGVLVTLGLLTVLLTEATDLTGLLAQVARSGVPIAAILMSGGFFLAAAGRGRTRARPAGLALVTVGALFLAVGAGTLGVALLIT